jgi:DNA-binding MarR family transcriptional regulator
MVARPFVETAAADANMTCRQVAILLMMAHHPSHSVKHIARALGLSRPVITRATDRLVLLKLASRSMSSSDRRQVELAPTRAGLRLLREAGLWHSA